MHQHFYCTQKWSKVKHEYGQSVVEWLVCLNLASFCDRRFMDVTKSSDVLIDHQIILPAILCCLFLMLVYIWLCACLVRFMHLIGDRNIDGSELVFFCVFALVCIGPKKLFFILISMLHLYTYQIPEWPIFYKYFRVIIESIGAMVEIIH